MLCSPVPLQALLISRGLTPLSSASTPPVFSTVSSVARPVLNTVTSGVRRGHNVMSQPTPDALVSAVETAVVSNNDTSSGPSYSLGVRPTSETGLQAGVHCDNTQLSSVETATQAMGNSGDFSTSLQQGLMSRTSFPARLQSFVTAVAGCTTTTVTMTSVATIPCTAVSTTSALNSAIVSGGITKRNVLFRRMCMLPRRRYHCC